MSVSQALDVIFDALIILFYNALTNLILLLSTVPLFSYPFILLKFTFQLPSILNGFGMSVTSTTMPTMLATMA